MGSKQYYYFLLGLLASVIVIAVCGIILLQFLQGCEDAELHHVIVLARHGERYPIIPLPGLQYRFAELTPYGIQQMQILGQRLLNRYHSFIASLTDVHRIVTLDERCIDSSREILSALGLNSTSFKKLPPLFPDGLTGLYEFLKPIYGYVLPQIPECIRLLVKKQVPTNASANWIAFQSLLIMESIDALNKSMMHLPTGLEFSDNCVPFDRVVLTPEMFFNLTWCTVPLLMPTIDHLLLQVLSMAKPPLKAGQLPNNQQSTIITRTLGAETISKRGRSSLSVYGISDLQIELLLMCSRAEGSIPTRPKNGAYIIFEIRADEIRMFFGSQWNAKAVTEISLDSRTFVEIIRSCRYIIEPIR
ncbi:hypothetical protein BIW11_12212 [Tropilaelaps mercedesae]|uniref:Lysosomal acid phosphatase-like n=1 Tax=Tropilaelaps mercedesae TaxID=418985 RepID=A0A1V9X7G2_9ACAR|nr:hypothetical protein BIW11_12212 [Tropilaelaps mercedesae]